MAGGVQGGGGASSSTGPAGGGATGAGTKVGVTLQLSQLQNFCKRDPVGYREDYEAQVRRLESELGLVILSPSTEPSPRVMELIQFAAAVSSSSYQGAESDRIAQMLLRLLIGSSASTASSSSAATAAQVAQVSTMPTSALQLHRDVRKSCVSALILMRNKGVIPPLRLLEPFFRLMAVIPDKSLREHLYHYMVSDIRNINNVNHRNGKRRDEQVNRSIQSFLHRVVASHGSSSATSSPHPGHHSSAANDPGDAAATDVAAKRATDMVCELYRRRVWTDVRAVAIVATAVQSPNTTVMCRAMRFFLGIEEKMAADAKAKEEEDWEEKNRVDYHKYSKKTHARQRQTERMVKTRKKHQQKKENADWMEADPEQDKGVEAAKKLYPAIELLRDPQGLAESVLKRLRGANTGYKYDVKLLMVNFVTRLVGNHKLLLLPLYSFLQKYMGGQQKDVTAVLAYAVQACHEHVPPDEVYGILKTIAHNFITERCSEEQMAVGINAARAICARVPSVLSVEESRESTGSATLDVEAFARDLAAYGNHRDRSVSIAGKAWTNFIREVYPGLLQGKHRGLQGTALHRSGARPLRYGEQKVSVGVEGADLLVEYEAKKAALRQKRDRLNEDDDDDDDDDDEEEGPQQEEGDEPDEREADEVEEEANDFDAFEEEEEEEIDENDDDGWVDVDDDGEEGNGENENGSDDDEEAPNLVQLDDAPEVKDGAQPATTAVDISKMSSGERDKLKQQISATRIFTTSDFVKMQKLVEREQQAKKDPRAAARRKRAEARGEGLELLSGDEASDSEDESDDDAIRVAGAVDPKDIMAAVKKKRQSKAERLEKIVAGRTQFESKQRAGGTTNEEKKRKKNFLMSKYSDEARDKRNVKASTLDFNKRKRKKLNLKHEAKKRRRKV